MRVWANPGRLVVLVAEISLEGSESPCEVAVDVESGKPITLAELLRSFRENGDEPELGWVQITIEPTRPRRGSSLLAPSTWRR